MPGAPKKNATWPKPGGVLFGRNRLSMTDRRSRRLVQNDTGGAVERRRGEVDQPGQLDHDVRAVGERSVSSDLPRLWAHNLL